MCVCVCVCVSVCVCVFTRSFDPINQSQFELAVFETKHALIANLCVWSVCNVHKTIKTPAPHRLARLHNLMGEN